MIAPDSGNLKLDTNTLGYSDIAGKDKEHGYYLNVGGSYGTGSSTTQDSSQVGKGDNQKNGWSVEGWNYNKDREQIVRGTVGAGDVVVRSDTGGKDSAAGLNRDVDKAYEITRDDEHRTDLYVTKSSLEAVASPKETLDQWQKSAALYGENSRNTLDKLADMLVVTALLPLGAAIGAGTELARFQVARTELLQQLNSQDESKRSAGVRAVLSGVAKKDLGSDAEALVTRITELGADHPDQALQAMVLLTTLNKPTDASSFVPVVAMGAGAVIALSAALSTTAATPEGQDRLREAANAVARSVAQSGQSAEQQVSTSIEIWKFLFSTTFPVHLLDGENSRLVNPIVQAQGANPSSDGYAAGATLAGIGSTGGSQIADQTPVDYSRPVVELPAPGVMNQGVEDGPKGALPGGQTVAQFEKSLSSLPPGERVAEIKSAAASVMVANGLVKNNKLSKLNGRDVYDSNDGNLYAMDTQHGRFEVINPKNGKHLGEVNFEFKQTKPADKTGGHDLKIK